MAGGKARVSADGGRWDSRLAVRGRPSTPCPYARAGHRSGPDCRNRRSGPQGDAPGDPGRGCQFAGDRVAGAGCEGCAGLAREGSPAGPQRGALAKSGVRPPGGHGGGIQTRRRGRVGGSFPPQPGGAAATELDAVAQCSVARCGMALPGHRASRHGTDPEPGALGRGRRVRAGGPQSHDRHQRARPRWATDSPLVRQHRAPALAGGGVRFRLPG